MHVSCSEENLMTKIDKINDWSIKIFSFLIIAFCVVVVSSIKLNDLARERSVLPENLSMKERTRQLECLAINIYKEAGYEPFEGKVAVAQVTLNRVQSSNFPDDVCQVVYQKNVVYEKVVCQFSWYCDRAHKGRPVNPNAYQESLDVAKKVLFEGFRLPGLDQALFYHADYVRPQWRNKEKITKIGAHIFYRPKEVL